MMHHSISGTSALIIIQDNGSLSTTPTDNTTAVTSTKQLSVLPTISNKTIPLGDTEHFRLQVTQANSSKPISRNRNKGSNRKFIKE